MARPRNQNVPRTHKRRRRYKWSVVGLVILLVLFIGWLNWPRFWIKEVEVVGNKLANASDIANLVEGELEQRIIWLFPRRHIWLYPRAALRARLLEVFPRLATAQIYRDGDSKLRVVVSERRGRYIWCEASSAVPAQASEQCHFVDATGVVFAPAPHFSRPIFLEFVGDKPAEDDFESLVELKNQIELLLQNKLGSDWYISRAMHMGGDDWRFSAKQLAIDFNIQHQAVLVNNLTAVFNDPALGDKFMRDQDRLLSLDLRFPPKIFYRFGP